MLSIVRQVICEWEKSQGRDFATRTLDEHAKSVLDRALKSCEIEPSDENIKILDTCLELLHCKTVYEEE
jgi:hypothetical protein